jgi:hypothetical protein
MDWLEVKRDFIADTKTLPFARILSPALVERDIVPGRVGR